jgi:hypothetical protein
MAAVHFISPVMTLQEIAKVCVDQLQIVNTVSNDLSHSRSETGATKFELARAFDTRSRAERRRCPAMLALENPNAGIVEADEMDFRRCLEIQMPYLGPVKGFYTEWTPLTDRPDCFPKTSTKAIPDSSGTCWCADTQGVVPGRERCERSSEPRDSGYFVPPRNDCVPPT